MRMNLRFAVGNGGKRNGKRPESYNSTNGAMTFEMTYRIIGWLASAVIDMNGFV